jgi:hypothetical protein
MPGGPINLLKGFRIKMPENCGVGAAVRVRDTGGSVTAIGSDPEQDVNVPSSVSFPRLAATRHVTAIRARAYDGPSIKSVTIPRIVQILCSFGFARSPLAFEFPLSVSFETDSQLRCIESHAFARSCHLMRAVSQTMAEARKARQMKRFLQPCTSRKELERPVSAPLTIISDRECYRKTIFGF